MIRVAIVGYGNLGKSLHKAIMNQSDMQLTAIFSRRHLDIDKYVDITCLENYADQIDCLALAMGSYNDIAQILNRVAGRFDTVDSYDNHNHIEEYKKLFGNSCINNKTVSLVSIGWDPGLMSIERALFSILPNSVINTFWGNGISQGHSNAIRCIDGVINAVQYTQPKPSIIDQCYYDKLDCSDSSKTHNRICYVACKRKDRTRIYQTIVTMPNYFDRYDTQVYFVSPTKIESMQQDMSHKGYIVSHSDVGRLAFALYTKSNPDITANIITSYIRAIYRLKQDGIYGCLDCLDIAPKYLIDNFSVL